MITIAIVFILYLALMVGIGFKFYNKTSNLSDYFLGGRNLGSWLTALSAQASDMSGWLLIGLPGTAYVIYAGTIRSHLDRNWTGPGNLSELAFRCKAIKKIYRGIWKFDYDSGFSGKPVSRLQTYSQIDICNIYRYFFLSIHFLAVLCRSKAVFHGFRDELHNRIAPWRGNYRFLYGFGRVLRSMLDRCDSGNDHVFCVAGSALYGNVRNGAELVMSVQDWHS